LKLPRWTVYPALAALVALISPAIPWRGTAAPAADGAPRHPRLVVLGIDGLDPEILAEVMARYPERMENFRWLASQADGIRSLGTSLPPQSPVAWSNFITGRDPGGHGIFDFIHRDPVTRAPAASVTRPTEGTFFGLLPGGEESNRSGPSFWQVLAENGVPADVWRMPANFPVEESNGWSFSGMMTPAIDSAYGQPTLYTTDPLVATELDYDKIVDDADFVERDGVIRTFVLGPEVELDGRKAPARAPIKLFVDRDAGAVAIDTGTERVVLEPGQWSRFLAFEFEVQDLVPGWLDWLPGVDDPLPGVARFYLRSIDPEVELYASPVNIDPSAPAIDVSAPGDAAAEVAQAVGTFYTQGMPEDVNALKEGILSDDEFLAQCKIVYREGRGLFDYALDRYLGKRDGGLLFFYFSTVDLMSHMLWRHADPHHPHHDAAFAQGSTEAWSERPGSRWREVIDDVYLCMDPVLGRLRERLEADGQEWTLLLMSDHGFASYDRQFALNTWLLERGYLVTKEPVYARPSEAEAAAGAPVDGEGFLLGEGGQRVPATDGRALPKDHPHHQKRYIFAHVDWSKTRAYGMGFNGLYLNLAGRELDDPHTPEDESGIVDPAQADALLAEIAAELTALRDPQNGAQVVLRADLAREAYRSRERLAEAPDLLVGFAAGYCNSDPASTGEIPNQVLADNLGGTFNGSHLMAPEVVPGILLSNRPLRPGDHDLTDLTVEVLGFYGIERQEGMIGERVLAGP
jgi:predicted AlkP superfamily phosphohydrolase/phosphomutase